MLGTKKLHLRFSRLHRVPRRTVLIMTGLSSWFAAGMLESLIGPTVSSWAQRFGISEGAFGILFAVTWGVALLTTPIAGRIVDRLGAPSVLACILGMSVPRRW